MQTSSREIPIVFERDVEFTDLREPVGKEFVAEHALSEFEKEARVGNHYRALPAVDNFLRHVTQSFRLEDIFSGAHEDTLQSFRDVFFTSKWHRVYDLIQFFVESKAVPADKQRRFIESVNSILKEEVAGYRFVSDQIVQITSEEEIAAIEQALALPDSLKPVREHLNQSLTLLADRTNPDYRNSIKESISAVESLSKIVAKLPKTTLSPALAAIEKKTALHPSLKEAFQKLYGYTNDAQGIRHALMDEPNLDIEDAKFMPVSCSAFVNYLVVKAQKAGIAI